MMRGRITPTLALAALLSAGLAACGDDGGLMVDDGVEAESAFVYDYTTLADLDDVEDPRADLRGARVLEPDGREMGTVADVRATADGDLVALELALAEGETREIGPRQARYHAADNVVVLRPDWSSLAPNFSDPEAIEGEEPEEGVGAAAESAASDYVQVEDETPTPRMRRGDPAHEDASSGSPEYDADDERVDAADTPLRDIRAASVLPGLRARTADGSEFATVSDVFLDADGLAVWLALRLDSGGSLRLDADEARFNERLDAVVLAGVSTVVSAPRVDTSRVSVEMAPEPDD